MGVALVSREDEGDDQVSRLKYREISALNDGPTRLQCGDPFMLIDLPCSW